MKVIYSYWVHWAFRNDQLLISEGMIDAGDFIMAGGNPQTRKWLYFFSRAFFKAVNILSGRLHVPMPEEWMVSRPSFYLERAAKKYKADLYIAHNLGALSACVKAAKKWNARSGFDAEDFHRGEYEQTSDRRYAITKNIEDRYLPLCDYTTAASPLIASAYRAIDRRHDYKVISNVFSRQHLQSPELTCDKGLSIFWFSQTIGGNRGLEMVVDAMEMLPMPDISLHLMGEIAGGYREQLLSRSSHPERIHFISPALPDDIFKIAAGFDIGLAAETPHCDNRDFCLTNKLFTYVLAGNCILASDTSAQKQFFSENPDIGLLYRCGDVHSLKAQLEKLYNDREILRQCRKKALQLACDKFNWENESKLFLNIIQSVLRDK